MTAGSGDLSPRDGSSAEPSLPTGRPTESGSSSATVAGEFDVATASPRSSGSSAPSRRQGRRGGSGQRLFAFDRRLVYRYVGGADEAGRGCLAGPLVAAGV